MRLEQMAEWLNKVAPAGWRVEHYEGDLRVWWADGDWAVISWHDIDPSDHGREIMAVQNFEDMVSVYTTEPFEVPRRYRLVDMEPDDIIGIEDTRKREIIGRFSNWEEAAMLCATLESGERQGPFRVSKKRYPDLTWWERRKVWWSMRFGGTFSRKKGDKHINVYLPGDGDPDR